METQNLEFRIKNLNEKGIALVMVMVLAMISLAIVSAMLFMATQGTVISGAQKFYSTAEEASIGAAELSTLYLSSSGTFNLLGVGISQRCNCGDPMVTTDNIDKLTGARSCRCDKLCNATADWPTSCDENSATGIQVSLDPASPLTRIDGTPANDFTFALGKFTLYTKIVDTVRGNTEQGTIVASGELGGSAVSAGAGGIITPPHSPYLYRMEVQAEATDNPREMSKISVLYAH